MPIFQTNVVEFYGTGSAAQFSQRQVHLSAVRRNCLCCWLCSSPKLIYTSSKSTADDIITCCYFNTNSCIPQINIYLVFQAGQTNSAYGVHATLQFTGTSDAIGAAVHRELFVGLQHQLLMTLHMASGSRCSDLFSKYVCHCSYSAGNLIRRTGHSLSRCSPQAPMLSEMQFTEIYLKQAVD